MADNFDLTAKRLVEMGQALSTPRLPPDGNIPYIVIPEGYKVAGLESFIFNSHQAKPTRIKQTVNVGDAVSFLEYYTLFSDENSRIFADESQSTVLAVMDYHGSGAEGGPRWCDHQLRLSMKTSPEWQSWCAANGSAKAMDQATFAEFVEDHTPDFHEPKAATMLEMARSMQAKADVTFDSSIRTANGQVQLTYNEQVQGTFGQGKIEIPEQFIIAIPVYLGTPRVPLLARLRYRIRQGKLSIWYDLLRADQVRRDAFMKELDAIKTTTGRNVINGTPAK